MYKVDISPAANSVLEEYAFRCINDNGTECALHFIIDQITKMRKNNLARECKIKCVS